MLQQVFAGGQVTLLSNLRNHFYTALPMIKSEIMSALKAKGMYTVDPDSAAGYLGLGFLLVALPYAALAGLWRCRFSELRADGHWLRTDCRGRSS